MARSSTAFCTQRFSSWALPKGCRSASLRLGRSPIFGRRSRSLRTRWSTRPARGTRTQAPLWACLRVGQAFVPRSRLQLMLGRGAALPWGGVRGSRAEPTLCRRPSLPPSLRKRSKASATRNDKG
eukprot:Amastigsp_a174546_23.p5 type:complete len:125 gc:universal Amastigsp_a174546_23:508-134(-)